MQVQASNAAAAAVFQYSLRAPRRYWQTLQASQARLGAAEILPPSEVVTTNVNKMSSLSSGGKRVGISVVVMMVVVGVVIVVVVVVVPWNGSLGMLW